MKRSSLFSLLWVVFLCPLPSSKAMEIEMQERTTAWLSTPRTPVRERFRYRKNLSPKIKPRFIEERADLDLVLSGKRSSQDWEDSLKPHQTVERRPWGLAQRMQNLFSFTPCISSPSCLKEVYNLHTLHVGNMNLADQEANALLVGILSNSPQLIELHLTHNKLSNKWVETTFRKVSSPCPLEELDLSHNEIKGSHGAFVAIFCKFKTVSKVNLSCNQISLDGYKTLNKVLALYLESRKLPPRVYLEGNPCKNLRISEGNRFDPDDFLVW